jgi:heme A synthase
MSHCFCSLVLLHCCFITTAATVRSSTVLMVAVSLPVYFDKTRNMLLLSVQLVAVAVVASSHTVCSLFSNAKEMIPFLMTPPRQLQQPQQQKRQQLLVLKKTKKTLHLLWALALSTIIVLIWLQLSRLSDSNHHHHNNNIIYYTNNEELLTPLTVTDKSNEKKNKKKERRPSILVIHIG